MIILPCCTNSELKNEKQNTIIFGVNAYSFADLLSARESRDNDQVYSLFNLLDWCKTQNIKALDPTGYFFPTYPEVPSDEYIEKFKNRAAELGIAISGTGIRNNFASPDPEVRAEGVELAKKWLVVASKLGAPVLRVFAGEIPKGYEDNWEEPAGWMIECYKELLPVAKQYGVKIGIQNHGDILQTAEQCLYVIKAFDSEWSEKYKRPLTLGEFGAYEKADMDSRVRWTNFVAREAEARGWSFSYWQFDSDFILYDIDKDEWVMPILNALIPEKE